MKWNKNIKNTLIYQNLKYAYRYGFKKKYHNNLKEKINIVFLVERTEVWNSVRSIYEAAKKNEYVNVYLVALQPFKNGTIKTDDNSVYEFCLDIDRNTIKAYNSLGEYFNIAELNPDYIFLSVPYENEYPDCYQFDKLSKIAKLCYVSYGYTMVKSKIQKITVRPSIIKNVDYIFSCNKIMYSYYHARMILTQLIGGKRLYNIGFPRFDLYRSLPQLNSQKKTIMWLPRWTTSSEVVNYGNEPSSFFEIKDKIIDYMAGNKESKLIIRPHPKAFENYIKHNMMTQEEVAEYKAKIKSADNVELDVNPSYYENLIQADVLVADFTSILAEYFVMGRPIIYLGNGNNYPPEHKDMYNSFYHAKKWKDVEKILDNLRNGIDTKKEQREKAVREFMKNIPDNVGEEIIDILTKDFKTIGGK